MVARSNDDSPPPDGQSPADPVSGLLHTWRRLVTATREVVRRGADGLPASRPARALKSAARYVRDPDGVIAGADDDTLTRLAEAGAAALAFGAALSYLAGMALGVPPVQRFLSIGWLAGWALVRLLIMRIAGRGRPFARRSAVQAAWGASLLPYLVAVAWPLDLVALAASAVLARRNLVALGSSVAEANRAVLLAFGGQAAAEALAWAARGGVMFGLFLAG